jgi:hypothetical protein
VKVRSRRTPTDIRGESQRHAVYPVQRDRARLRVLRDGPILVDGAAALALARIPNALRRVSFIGYPATECRSPVYSAVWHPR